MDNCQGLEKCLILWLFDTGKYAYQLTASEVTEAAEVTEAEEATEAAEVAEADFI